ncbi:probable 4-coumarate--CoA ligase 3 isoform X2 [Bradysia coprophila]|uniref:probable 4-coumarate--CoA ligase 3 isoform X2 n=1 Tax=Bradysia coprophila TaxID=38358 RepID=UPI00187D81DC|nr:probable 4-coumarate--CoA ligase 3 isoform X2 [Bradysia coprophila]
MFASYYDKVKKTWSGPRHNVNEYNRRSAGEVLLERMSNGDPNRVVQIDGDTGEAMVMREIRIRTIRIAQNLLKQGCTQDDRVAIIARNAHNITPLAAALLCIGTPFNALDINMIEDDSFLDILERIEPKFIFCDADAVEPILKARLAQDTKVLIVNGKVKGFDVVESLLVSTKSENEFSCQPISDLRQHTAVMICSSGSTGLPKSVMLSHTLFIDEFVNNSFFVGAERMLSFSSLYWISGVWAFTNSIISKNIRIFTAKPFSPEHFCDLVGRYQVKAFLGPASRVHAVVNSEAIKTANLLTLKTFCLAGEPTPSTMIQAVRNYIPDSEFRLIYGMSEIGGMTCTTPMDIDMKPTSVGCLVRGFEVKIVDENGGNTGIDQIGEIHVKAPAMFTAYHKNDEATRSAVDGEGFYKSGDLGYFDKDGCLFVTGRKKEIFKCNLFHIAPIEIESVVLKHPAVHSVCVVGVRDEEKLMDLPAAVIVKKDGAVLKREEIYAFVAERIAEYKWLKGGIYFVDALHTTISGKILRSKVKEFANELYEKEKNVGQQIGLITNV